MKAWATATLVVLASLVTSWSARADPLRILIAVSSATGASGELPLHHAADDAQQVSEVLNSLGGFHADDSVVLVDPSMLDVSAALAHARARAREHPASEVTFVFYFSGHGDRDHIHLGGESLAVSALSAEVRSVPAGMRVLVTDACRSYPTRMKGATSEPGFAITTSPDNAGSGVVWLFASGDGEPAQESDELRGALFTHYWVDALRGAGDANGDGRVTVAESYDFAYSQTLFRSSAGSGVAQHPAAIFELREAAPVVLTTTNDGATALRLPRTADTRYFVYAIGSQTILGEIWGSADHAATLALPPGRYLVQRRGPAGAAGVEIALARGDVRALSSADFRAIQGEELARKGGEIVLRPEEVSAGLDVQTSRLAPLQGAAHLAYTHAWPSWATGIEIRASYGRTTTSAEQVSLESFGLAASFERRWRIAPWTFGLGAGAEADVVAEKLVRTDAARVELAGYPTIERATAFAPGPRVQARVRLASTSGWFVEAAATGVMLLPELDGSIAPLFGARAGGSIGMAF